MTPTVAIGPVTGPLEAKVSGRDVIAVDVIRATTTAITAVEEGRRCFPVASLAEAEEVAPRLDRPLLVGEQRGDRPDGFDLNNSPAALASHPEPERPVGRSAGYLGRSGQLQDLEFVLGHVDDVDSVFAMREGEVVRV